MTRAARRAVKLNGAGNEILVVDLRGSGVRLSGAQARAIAATQGLRFDQLMALEEPRAAGTAAFMTIYNTDGSRSAACGNGTRCVAFTLLVDGAEAVTLETDAGLLPCRRVSDHLISVEMGRPRLAAKEIPLSREEPDTRAIDLSYGPPQAPVLSRPAAVNMGNPHVIFFVETFEPYDLGVIGPALEHDPMFPERANISLALVESRARIALKVWERGAGLTRACGSAACAALVAAVRRGLTGRRAIVALPGGELDILWREDDDVVVMTGPVEFEFEARLDPALFAGEPA